MTSARSLVALGVAMVRWRRVLMQGKTKLVPAESGRTISHVAGAAIMELFSRPTRRQLYCEAISNAGSAGPGAELAKVAGMAGSLVKSKEAGGLIFFQRVLSLAVRRSFLMAWAF